MRTAARGAPPGHPRVGDASARTQVISAGRDDEQGHSRLFLPSRRCHEPSAVPQEMRSVWGRLCPIERPGPPTLACVRV